MMTGFSLSTDFGSCGDDRSFSLGLSVSVVSALSLNVSGGLPVTLTPSDRWHHTDLSLSFQALVLHS